MDSNTENVNSYQGTLTGPSEVKLKSITCAATSTYMLLGDKDMYRHKIHKQWLFP